MKNKRSKAETIELFRQYAYDFAVRAHRTESPEEKARLNGKSEAYEMAAFELERNMI